MKISVIISVYNSAPYLEEALESILNQTFNDFELLIIDDKSTDGSRKILKKIKDKRVRVFYNKKRLGLTKNLNKLFKISVGEYIARMDSDDVAHPERLELQANYLDNHPHIAIVGTWADIIGPDGKKIGEIKQPKEDHLIRESMIKFSPFVHPSIMFRKSLKKDVGFYDDSFSTAQDYEFFARILVKHRGANIPRKLMKYRWDMDNSVGFTTGKSQEWNALRARFRMLFRYGWPLWQIVYLWRPVLSFFVPMWVKKRILEKRMDT